MNCDQARDKLIELVYDELPAADRAALEAHLAACGSCRAELGQLRRARAALAESYAHEPMAARFHAPASMRAWLAAGAAVAAAGLLALGVWMLHGGGTPVASAQPGPVRIEPVGVSLTILSAPEDAAPADMPMQQQADVQIEVQMPTENNVQMLRQVQTTINNGGAWGHVGRFWQGMALVRDQRIVRNLEKGASQVRFSDVPSGILPDSVRLCSLDRPDGLTILEQNYQYDLASAVALLRRYVDRPVTAVFKDGQTVRGVLLSFDAQQLVIRPAGEGPRNVARERLLAIALDKLPKGLLAAPTLVWELDNRAAARQQFEVAYLTHGLTWRADYVLKLHPARQAQQAAVAEKAPGPPAIADIIDTADLVGYATVNNFSGTIYKDAQLKLLAGDVNLIQPPMEQHFWYAYGRLGELDDAAPAMTEKSFFEYHLYTVTRPTTLHNAETKQLLMVSGQGVRLRRGYVYDPQANQTAVRVVSELMNSEANGLGKPLPKGVVRLYAPDPGGAETYVAQTTIDHTPKDEKLRLPWGYAFDIACTTKQTDYGRRDDDHQAEQLVQLRSHKDIDVNVTVMARIPPSTYQAECKGFRWHVRQVGLVEIDVPLKANSTADVKFSYRWNPFSGGGLKNEGNRE